MTGLVATARAAFAGGVLGQTVVLLIGPRRVLLNGGIAARGAVVAGLCVEVLVMAFTLVAGVGLRTSLVEVVPVAVVVIDIEFLITMQTLVVTCLRLQSTAFPVT